MLTLIVCSNRKNLNFSDVWKNVIRDPSLKQIVLVTQGAANSYRNTQKKVVHIQLPFEGRSRAVNVGLQYVHSEYVGLTDDDCILNSDWIKQSELTLRKTAVDMVFGQTRGYQPEKHPGKTCPCTFSKKSKGISTVTRVCEHWLYVGFDNNVVIRKTVFDDIGGYKWWLGPGAIGKAAEDGEFILRSLLRKKQIGYNPRMIVYHDKWLTADERKRSERAYLLGGTAAYGFYAFQGVRQCYYIVRNSASGIAQRFRRMVKEAGMRSTGTSSLWDGIADFWYLLKGLCIAFVFAKFVPIPDRERI